MKKRYWLLLGMGILGLSLFAYNYWSYSCGRCNTESLLSLSFPAKILIGINAIALVGILVIRSRKHRQNNSPTCHCGAPLVPDWQFCPDCGQRCLPPA